MGVNTDGQQVKMCELPLIAIISTAGGKGKMPFPAPELGYHQLV
jgi:hypothetical protein